MTTILACIGAAFVAYLVTRFYLIVIRKAHLNWAPTQETLK